MQVKIYLLGSRDEENRTLMSAVIRPETGTVLNAKKYLEGYTELESKVVAVGWLLDRINDRFNSDIISIYADEFMSEAGKYADGAYKSCSKLIKDYTNFIKKIRKKSEIKFFSYSDVEDQVKSFVTDCVGKCQKIYTIQGNIFKDKVKAIPTADDWQKALAYSITIYKPDGTVFGHFDESSGFDDKKHAARFAGWYIKESKDSKSIFYNYRVELSNITPEFGDIYG